MQLLSRMAASMRSKPLKVYNARLIFGFANNLREDIMLITEAKTEEDAIVAFKLLALSKLDNKFVAVGQVNYSTDKVLSWELQHIVEVNRAKN